MNIGNLSVLRTERGAMVQWVLQLTQERHLLEGGCRCFGVECDIPRIERATLENELYCQRVAQSIARVALYIKRWHPNKLTNNVYITNIYRD